MSIYSHYENLDLEIEAYGSAYRVHVITSPVGQVDWRTFNSPFSAQELQAGRRLFGGVRHLRAKLNDAPPLDPMGFGRRLYEAVFAGEIGRCLNRSLEKVGNTSGLRIRLRLNNAPDLADLPWEMLYGPSPFDFFALSPRTPIVRYLATELAEEPLLVKLPLHILVVIANPSTPDAPALDVEAEMQQLNTALAGLQAKQQVVVERLVPPTLAALQTRLRSLDKPVIHLLHFIGHGQTGALVFESEQGKPEPVSAERLAVLLHDHPSLKLAFLNACQGGRSDDNDIFLGVAPKLIRGGLPAVIAMKYNVSDRTAIGLAAAFYQALADAYPVDAALAEARKAVFIKGSIVEWGTPVLFMRTPDGYLFDVKEIAAPPKCPYPGMAPFTENESQRFFGRAKESNEVVERLRLHPFLAVIGASGSGKSSLVFAGVLPALRKAHYFAETKWQVLAMRPGEKPFAALIQLLKIPLATPLTLDISPPLVTEHERLLLIVDQFEEVFTSSTPEEALAFQQALLQCAQLSNVYVLLTVRADFYANLMASPLWLQIQAHRLELKPLSRDDLREAIMCPAQAVDVELDPALVERLLDDAAGEPGVLPLMQETLVLLWGQVKRLSLSLSAYAELVGNNPARTGLQVAIARRADQAYAGLDEQSQWLARRTFLRLVQFGEGRADTRRQQPLAALYAADDDTKLVEQTIYRLTEHRLLLLTGEENAPDRTVDITHEALIEGWPKFQEWLKERRAAEKTRRNLEAKAVEWESLKRQGGWLDSIELAKAQNWLQSADAVELGHSQSLCELVQGSQSVEFRKKVQRWFAILISLVAIALLGLAGFFAFRNYITETERLKTVSRGQGNVALQQLTLDPSASLYQGVQALPSEADPKPHVPEAELATTQALRANLEREYRRIAVSTLASKQVATGTTWIAVGSDALRLVSYDLHTVITLTGHVEPIEAVQWDREGQVLLSRDQHSVHIWREQQSVAVQSFDEMVACAEWRPGFAQIGVCSGKALRLWSYQAKTLEPLYDFTETIESPPLWSPDGHWLVMWARAGSRTGQSLLLWDGQVRHPFMTTLAYAERIRAGAWSPDSRYFVTIGVRSQKIQLWSVDQPGRPIRIEVGARVDGVKFLDAQHFVTWGAGDVTRLWSANGELMEQFGVAEDGVQAVVFSPDKKQLLTFLADGAAYLWDIAQATRVAVFCCHKKPMLAAAWRDPNYLATSGGDDSVRVWEIATGKELVMLRGHTGRDSNERTDILGMHWQDQQQLLAYSQDGSAHIWQVFDAQGLPLCAGSGVDQWPICYNFSRAFTAFKPELTFARWLDKQSVITTDQQGLAHRFSLSTEDIRVLNQHNDSASVAVWSPDGRRVLTYTAGLDGRVLDFATGTLLATVTGPITTAFWLDNGLLISRGAGNAHLVQPETGATLAELSGYTSPITAVQLHRNGRLALAEENGPIHIWDSRQQQEVTQLGHDQRIKDLQPIHSLQWSQDGKRLLAAGSKIVVWNVENGQLLWASPETGFIVHADLSEDGQWVAVTVGTNFFVLNAENGDPIWQNQVHKQPVMGIRWVRGTRWPNQAHANWLFEALGRWFTGQPWQLSNTRPLLLTWSGDGTARLWDWEQRAEIMRVADTGPIALADVSEDGAHLFTVALSTPEKMGNLRIWDTWLQNPGALLDTVNRQLAYVAPDEQAQLFSLQLVLAKP